VIFTPGQQDKCFLCGQVGHLAAKCEGKAKRKAGEFDEKGDEIVPKKPYQVTVPLFLLLQLYSMYWVYSVDLPHFCVFTVLEYMDPTGIHRIRVQNAKSTFQD
jgi:hypothetical protein